MTQHAPRRHIIRITALLYAGYAALLALVPRTVAAQGSSRAPAVTTANSKGRVLTGTVVDVIGKPMQDSEVYIAGTDRSVRTDARGRWQFDEPPIGPRVLVARQIGYVPYVRELEIGGKSNDTVSLLLRRYPRTLSAVQVTARANSAVSAAQITAERLMQLRVGSGRLYTRDEILEQQPYSVAELIAGVVGITVARGQGEIVVTSKRAGSGSVGDGQPCQLQFFLDGTPIDNAGVATLSPRDFRSVEVYPQTVVLTGLAIRSDKCGAIVINSLRR